MKPVYRPIVMWMLLAAPVGAVELAGVQEYPEMCDASAIADAGDGYFFAANDEKNTLLLYHRDLAAEPIEEGECDLDEFLEVTSPSKESDIEGSARIGDVIYWIGSYGNNKDGAPRANRMRFFATRIEGSGKNAKIVPVGQPCQKALMDAIQSDSRLSDYPWKKFAELPPKTPGAFNIEGLAATPDGTLWIAFRNPVPDGKALLVELTNPAEVVQGTAPKLGRIEKLDLGGVGIRSMEYLPAEQGFVILSGPIDEEGKFHLWRWSGKAGEAATKLDIGSLEKCNAEAMTFFADRPGELFVLSDDGSRKVDGEDCKDAPKKKRHFRGGWLSLPMP
jgi:hypothetical protein